MANICKWISGFLAATGLMMFDEILTLAKYCGRDCLYTIPMVGSFDEYASESIAWVMLLASFILLRVRH